MTRSSRLHPHAECRDCGAALLLHSWQGSCPELPAAGSIEALEMLSSMIAADAEQKMRPEVRP